MTLMLTWIQLRHPIHGLQAFIMIMPTWHSEAKKKKINIPITDRIFLLRFAVFSSQRQKYSSLSAPKKRSTIQHTKPGRFQDKYS